MPVPSDFYTKIVPNYQTIETMMQDGATIRQICTALGVTVECWDKCVDGAGDFRLYLSDLKRDLVDRLKSSLIAQALPAQVEEIEETTNKDGETHVKVKRYRREGDFRATSFALKNLAPEEWRDVKAVDVTGKVGIIVKLPPPPGQLSDPNQPKMIELQTPEIIEVEENDEK